MSEVQVKAKKYFYWGDQVKNKRSAPFFVTKQQFNELKSKGMVEEYAADGREGAKLSPGASPSASPVGQVSQQTIVSQSADGSTQTTQKTKKVTQVRRQNRKAIQKELSASTPASE